jgi:hypothetical protein
MIKKMTASVGLLQKGKRVANPEAWKKGQVSVEALSGFLAACLTAYVVFTGGSVEVGGEELDTISTALITIVPAVTGLWGAISTVITTNKIGVQSKGSDTEEGAG